jgi:hypothetical protein
MGLSICHDMLGKFKQKQMSHQNRVNLGQNEIG